MIGALVHDGGGCRSREQGLEGCGYDRDSTWELTSVNQLNFIPVYRKYRGLGILGTNPNFIKWFCMWQQSPIANLLLQVFVTIRAAREASRRELCQGSC